MIFHVNHQALLQGNRAVSIFDQCLENNICDIYSNRMRRNFIVLLLLMTDTIYI